MYSPSASTSKRACNRALRARPPNQTFTLSDHNESIEEYERLDSSNDFLSSDPDPRDSVSSGSDSSDSGNNTSGDSSSSSNSSDSESNDSDSSTGFIDKIRKLDCDNPMTSKMVD